MTLIRDFKQNWSPSSEGSRNHVRITIKNYSQLDKLVFHRQLDSTLQGLVTAGHTLVIAQAIMIDTLRGEGYDENEWLNGRTAKEIIAN